MAESFHTLLGNPLPLSLTLPDGASGLFPRAFVYDSADVAVAGSPFDLGEVGATGRYTSAAFTPAAKGTFTAHYIVYSNSGHTVEATIYERDQDSFVVVTNDDIATAILDLPDAVDGNTWREFMRLAGAVLLGKLSGSGTLTEVFKAMDDSKVRVTVTNNPAGDRLTIVFDKT